MGSFPQTWIDLNLHGVEKETLPTAVYSHATPGLWRSFDTKTV